MSCTVGCVNAYYNNDGILEIEGLNIDGTLLNAATVTYQIYDADGTAVTGASGTLTAAGTGGNYTADVDKTIINLCTPSGEYTVRITGVEGTAHFEFNVELKVGRRGTT